MQQPYGPPPLMADFYKVSHRAQYPKGTEYVYSTWIPRESRLDGINKVVAFGFQAFVTEYLVDEFHDNFFARDVDEVCSEYERFIKFTLGDPSPDSSHLRFLHGLGYLPLEIRAVPEGTLVPLRVPMLTIENTVPECFWVTNFIETLFSCEQWICCTSATIALEYRKILDGWAKTTGADPDFVAFQGHDFSMRGMTSLQSAAKSGAGHLLSFDGTDTIPAIAFLEYFYGANIEEELVGTSIPATEHSVMCAYGEDEIESFTRIIKDVYPGGLVSIVSDTWDLWHVLTKILPSLKQEILARDGRVVIRPDSGDPVDIICGEPSPRPRGKELRLDHPVHKGVVELLWDTFGGTVNEKGYKVLDPHVGTIYGDSITIDRANRICERLAAKGFASSNVVFGIGSYCVAPETPILCADLVWRQAGDLKVGDEIVAFDDDKVQGQGKGHSRRYKTATITANNAATKACSRVATERGDTVTASDDHPWLIFLENTRQRGLVWKKTKDLVPGDLLAWFGEPWEVDNTRSGGWLAGIFDGEGSFAKQTGDRRISAYRPNVVQNEGWVLDQILVELDRRGFDYNIQKGKTAKSVVLRGGWRGALRFLGQIRPERLMERIPEILMDGPSLWRGKTFDCVAVKSVESVGQHPVASITTSAGTFITGGYLTHNTYQHVTRDTFGFALKSTWCVIDGKEKAIYKDPVTDTNHMKKSLTGKVIVSHDTDGELCVVDGLDYEAWAGMVNNGEDVMEPIFRDGILLRSETYAEIAARVQAAAA